MQTNTGHPDTQHGVDQEYLDGRAAGDRQKKSGARIICEHTKGTQKYLRFWAGVADSLSMVEDEE